MGGMAPSISGFIADKTGFQYTPALLLCLIAFTASLLFLQLQRRLQPDLQPTFNLQ
jgi:fucose permease